MKPKCLAFFGVVLEELVKRVQFAGFYIRFERGDGIFLSFSVQPNRMKAKIPRP